MAFGPSDFKPGDQIYFWFDTGAFGARQSVMTVVRVNPKTVTVKNGYDETYRLPYHKIAGHVDWED